MNGKIAFIGSKSMLIPRMLQCCLHCMQQNKYDHIFEIQSEIKEAKQNQRVIVGKHVERHKWDKRSTFQASEESGKRQRSVRLFFFAAWELRFRTVLFLFLASLQPWLWSFWFSFVILFIIAAWCFWWRAWTGIWIRPPWTLRLSANCWIST